MFTWENVAAKKDKELPPNLIREFFTDEQLKTLFYHALRVDIPNNNDKAEMIKHYLPSNQFDELGTGTNRMAFLHNGFVIKIAMDRRGLVDSFTETKRSIELPRILAKTYECNMIVQIQQYVNIIDQSQFMENEFVIKNILSQLSENYLFEDLGFTLKNCYNWGFVESDEHEGEMELRILDYGYLYPLYMQNKAELFRCPKCNATLKWNSNFTEFQCANSQCGLKVPPWRIKQKMKTDFEDLENRMISDLSSFTMPNFRDIEAKISGLKLQRYNTIKEVPHVIYLQKEDIRKEG